MGAPKDAADVSREAKHLEAELQGKQAPALDSAKVEADVAACVELAGAGRRQEALDGLLALEKQGRVAEDVSATRKAVTALLQVPSLLCAGMDSARWWCWMGAGDGRRGRGGGSSLSCRPHLPPPMPPTRRQPNCASAHAGPRPCSLLCSALPTFCRSCMRHGTGRGCRSM